ncbi:MAG: NAD-binding protein [Oscillospiraceae bacterium]|nr:NAD-binding protein [Oscillospiraceae bacterium]
MQLLIIGGDLRAHGFARLARTDGHEVFTFGHGEEQASVIPDTYDIVLLPIPIAEQGGYIPCVLSSEPILLPTISGLLTGGIWGGRQGAMLSSVLLKNGLICQDPNEIETYAVANAYLSAEGAVVSALARYPDTIKGAPVLVVGYGRIGRSLVRLLAAWGADVTVAARDTVQREWAKAEGAKAVDMAELSDAAASNRIIFQTAPAMLINEVVIPSIRKGTLVSDLTRSGVDIERASANGLIAWRDSGIPGKYAPDAAAKILYDTIMTAHKA